MIFHLCLRENGNETSSRLIGFGPQWAVEPRNCNNIFIENFSATWEISFIPRNFVLCIFFCGVFADRAFLLIPSIHCPLGFLSPPILGIPFQYHFWNSVTFNLLKYFLLLGSIQPRAIHPLPNAKYFSKILVLMKSVTWFFYDCCGLYLLLLPYGVHWKIFAS